MSTSSITKEDREFVETWEHVSGQRWGITRLDPRGEDRPEIISGRRKFRLTTEERIITQDRVVDEKLDPFLNGSFRPVIVPDSVTIESNPNALSDDEIRKILGSSDLAWIENLKVIDSVATIRRMLEVAEDEDISHKRYRELESRLESVRGEIRITSNDPHLKDFLTNRPNLDNGARQDAARRSGMSESYR